MNYKLSEIMDLIGGGTPKTTVPEYWNGDIYWLSVKDFLGNSRYVYDTEKKITQKGLENSSTKLLQKDDIIISARGTVGELAMIPYPMAFNQSCYGIRAKQNIVNNAYLFYLLKNSVKILQRNTHGSVFDTITRDTFDKITVSLPNLETQTKIASILTNIDDIIEANTSANINLQNQSFALFDKIISNSQSEKIPLSEIAELNPKRTIAKNTEARCIDMSQLSTSGSFPNGWETKAFNGGMRFQNGDTLLARITPCLENGKTAFIDFLDENEVAFGSTEYIVLCSMGEYPPQFFYCLARYPEFVEYAVKNMNGSSGRQRVSADIIGKYEIPNLTADEIKEFSEVVPPMFEVMRSNSLENIKLAHLRDTLLPKLISGELDVSEVNI